jgi:hypothetical protein
MALSETILASKVKLLVAGLLVVSGVGVGAVYTGAVDVDGVLGGDDVDLVDNVPEDVDVVMRLDAAVLDDDTTREMTNAALEAQQEAAPNYAGPEDYEAVMDDLEENTANGSLDADGFEEAVVFGKTPAASAGVVATDGTEQYTGVLVASSWDTEAFVNESEAGGQDYEETTVEGETVYVPEEAPEYGTATHIGVVGDGTFVVGTPEVVEDTMAVVAGEADAFGGDLREQFDATEDGYLQFAMAVPQDDIPEGAYENTGAGLNTNVFAEVGYVTGAYYADGDTVGMAVGMATGDAEDAKTLQDVTDGGISLLSGMTTNETASDTLDDVSVDREGSRVTLTYEAPVDDVSELLAMYYRAMSAPMGTPPTGTTY